MTLPTYLNAITMFLFCVCRAQKDAIVETDLGLVEGIVMYSTKQIPFYAYRGIPYAQPPLGDLRFRPPLPANPWSGIFDGTNDSPICAQATSTSKFEGTEDCLTLNIYTPQANDDSEDLLPVYVFIHGGKFVSGDASTKSLPPRGFMNHQIVLATISYRLGPFGFLSTDDEASPGNYGLLDQILALQWIQKNIRAFGGDPQKVTVGGFSAGAASTSYHLVSPLAKGLFRAVILQSGSFLCPWAIQREPKKWAEMLGSQLNCNDIENTTKLVHCLRHKSAEEISLMQDDFSLYKSFQPVIENRTVGRYLVVDPGRLLKKHRYIHVPVLAGVNKDELAYSLTDSADEQQEDVEDKIDLQLYPAPLRELIKSLEQNYGHHHPRSLRNLAVHQRTRRENFNQEEILYMAETVSIIMFKSPIDMLVRRLAEDKVPTYMYEFGYEGEKAPTFLGAKVANHGYEMNFYFDRYDMDDEDLEVRETVTELWVNFITNLNPSSRKRNILWKPTKNRYRLNFMHITQNGMKMGPDDKTSKILFLKFLSYMLFLS